MSEYFTNRNHDYKRRGFDTPPNLSPAEIKQSILTLRDIYRTISDKEFAAMYEKKYRIKKEAVLRVIGGVQQQ